ncbi:MAG: SDR family oxidoreductase [Deltaproteobacteria bacterium]|nr:SDR family oxidoreductase [Deltaproteobacteria bacterium]
MKDLKDKIALVTGAGQGIGREIALALAREGCQVVVNDIVKEKAEEVTREIVSRGCSSQSMVADISDRSQMESMCIEALSRFGRIDIMVHNAAVRVAGRVEEIPVAEWERILNANVWSQIIATRVLLPSMLEKKRGHFVHIASLAGLWAGGMILPYATTKFANVGFAEALSAQVRSSGIKVTLVCPAFVRTPSVGAYRVSGKEPSQESFVKSHDWFNNHWGMDPEKVAEKVVRAIRKDQFLVLIPAISRLLLLGRVLFPQAFLRLNSRITDRVLR